MTLRGSVQDFPLRAVVDLLAQTKKTGELQVRAGDGVGALGIADGRVVTAVFGEEEPLLALAAIFALGSAEFEFTPWDDAPPANLEGTLDTLLRRAAEARKQADEARRKAEEEREAARKKAEEEREAERKRLEELRGLIPSDDLAFRLSERAVDQGAVTLTSERWRIVLAVNGERDLNALASMLHLDHDAALSSLAALVREHVIETVAPPAPAYEPPPPAYEAAPPSIDTAAQAFEPRPESTEAAAPPAFEPSRDTFGTTSEAALDYPTAEAAAAPEIPAGTENWITPEEAVPTEDWTATSPTESAPISEVAPQWGATPQEPAQAQDWVTPQVADTPAMDDRLSALSGIFGPAPAEPSAPADAEPPVSSWAPPATGPEQWGTPAPPSPAAERWTAPPAARPATPATDDPWGSPPPPAPTHETPWTPSASPAPEKDAWVAPAPAQSTWSAPASGTTSVDPWRSPGADARSAGLSIPEPGTPPVEEWSPPPAALPEKKKRGLFGFGREKPAPPPVAGRPLPTAGVVGSRVGMLAALANTLIAEYNNGQYGKGRIEEHMPNLLMRVDEQADPIDRPLPIVDDRIDVEAIEREHLADAQALPYLALLVTTIFADAEKTFGKDKAKKGYKAAQKSVLLGDASALSTPELAGKLPKV
ncbi:MAG TPA: DUF4388 domain-containing protein [Candidatus Limnocylindria bacterium]|nr:DUF4388 domain-containing protein [Candidatus Limnocylindria bacterium]